MYFRGPIAQPGSELPAHNRLVPGSNPGGPIPFAAAASPAGPHNQYGQTIARTRTTLAEEGIA
jgi:hypothetical protein